MTDTTHQEGHMDAQVAEFVTGFTFEHDGHSFEVRADRIVRDGKEVAVLLSPGWGAGFITWCTGVSPFEPKLVALVLAGKQDVLVKANEDRSGVATAEVAEWLGLGDDDHLYLGGADDLEIRYVPLGMGFEYDEHDGNESLRLFHNPPFVA